MVQPKRKRLGPAAPVSHTERRPLPPQPSIDEEFTAFFQTHYRPLLSFATWWGKSPHDAEDALSVVMEYLYWRWAEIREPVRYARRAVPRTILKIRRDRGDDRYVTSLGVELPEEAALASEFEQMEGEEWTNELLAVLPRTQRLVLSRFLDGLSLKEISDELRKSESTIRQNLKLARDRLRPHVQDYDRKTPCRSDEQTTRGEDR